MRQSKENVSPMSNEGRNLYVVEHITASLLELMKTKHIDKISIGELCNSAGVGRASFYRNFKSKEDVISKHLKALLDNWWLNTIQQPDFNLIEAIFTHYWNNRELCHRLYEQGLSHLNLQSIKEACGPKSEHENVFAYTTAYFSYGLYGWIDEWFHRGMQETPKEMAALWENSHLSKTPT